MLALYINTCKLAVQRGVSGMVSHDHSFLHHPSTSRSGQVIQMGTTNDSVSGGDETNKSTCGIKGPRTALVTILN